MAMPITSNSKKKPQVPESYGNYTLKNNKLYVLKEIKGEDEPVEYVVSEYVKIKEIRQDMETKNVELVLEYRYKGVMHDIAISRKQLEVSELRKLLEKGVDVHDHKVKEVAKFLSIQEASAPLTQVHQQVGWAVHEERPIYKHYKVISSDPIDSTYDGALKLEPKGTMQGWRQTIMQEVLGKVELELALVFGFTAAIVGFVGEDLDLDTLVFHIFGDSTRGKTTAAQVAASSFGKPSTKQGGLIQTWNGTQNALIGQLADNKGLPIVFDEASMNRMNDFTSMIYLIAGGTEKARMSKDVELRERKTWSTTVLSTAEHSLLHKANQNVGLMMRLFEFGNITWTKDARNADTIKAGLLEHYGQAGILFVDYVLQAGKPYVLKKWRTWAETCLDSMPETDTFSTRISNKLALILVTADLVRESLKLDLNMGDLLQFLIEHELESMSSRDLGQNAYDYFKGMIIQHRSKFVGDYFREKGQECWGKLTTKGASIEVNMLKEPFQRLMKEGGFDDDKVVLQHWKDKGYLIHEANKLTQRKTLAGVQGIKSDKQGRATTYCIKFRREDLELGQPLKDIPDSSKGQASSLTISNPYNL
ncbi:DUF927 domain-containing protein [Oceanobacillus massiliensis]|uniref:DUF927 domain-containing protein n=1 Tax=Oceanobacillus massiliensis TaxID=1465765 RepID=UPI003017E0F6